MYNSEEKASQWIQKFYKNNVLEMVHHPVLLKVMKLLFLYILCMYNIFIRDLLSSFYRVGFCLTQWPLGQNYQKGSDQHWVTEAAPLEYALDQTSLGGSQAADKKKMTSIHLIGAKHFLYFKYIYLKFGMKCGWFYVDLALKKWNNICKSVFYILTDFWHIIYIHYIYTLYTLYIYI